MWLFYQVAYNRTSNDTILDKRRDWHLFDVGIHLNALLLVRCQYGAECDHICPKALDLGARTTNSLFPWTVFIFFVPYLGQETLFRRDAQMFIWCGWRRLQVVFCAGRGQKTRMMSCRIQQWNELSAISPSHDKSSMPYRIPMTISSWP